MPPKRREKYLKDEATRSARTLNTLSTIELHSEFFIYVFFVHVGTTSLPDLWRPLHAPMGP